MRRTAVTLCSLLLTAILATACATTEITSSWRAEGYHDRLGKVLVLGVAKESATRKAFETAFANQLKNWGVNAVPGFSVLADPETRQEEIMAAAGNAGADAVLVTKLTSVSKETQKVTDIDSDRSFGPGRYPYYYGRYPYRYYPYYDHWYSDYATSYTRVRTYDVEYQTLELETNLYEFASGELIWTALSRTTTAEPLQAKVADIAQKIIERLVRDGLI